jgi:peptidoglycan/LPS O-acetylase OafA/YrhL
MTAEGAAGVLGLTGDVIAAGATLAGLILVYLGSVAVGYAGFDPTAQPTVRASFQRRAWFSVVGVVLAISASGTAVLGKWLVNVCLAGGGAILLGLAFIWVVGTAVLIAFEVE